MIMTEQERKDLIEAELVKMADGDEQKLWRLRKFQASIDRELSKFVHPTARMNKAIEMMWSKFEELRSALNG